MSVLSGIPLYKVNIWDDDLVVGSCYESKLQKIVVSEITVYKVAGVIKSCMNRGRKELLVHLLGCQSKLYR
jgi:hypothetical protein